MAAAGQHRRMQDLAAVQRYNGRCSSSCAPDDAVARGGLEMEMEAAAGGRVGRVGDWLLATGGQTRRSRRDGQGAVSAAVEGEGATVVRRLMESIDDDCDADADVDVYSMMIMMMMVLSRRGLGGDEEGRTGPG